MSFHSSSSSILNQFTKVLFAGSYSRRMISFWAFSSSRTPPLTWPSVVMVISLHHFILPVPDFRVFMFLVSTYWCFSS